MVVQEPGSLVTPKSIQAEFLTPLPTSSWPSLSYRAHVGSEPVDGNISLSLHIYLSAFQSLSLCVRRTKPEHLWSFLLIFIGALGIPCA